MLRIYVDFNNQEEIDTVVIRLDSNLNSNISEHKMSPGQRVILNDETMECEAILQNGKHFRWVATIIPETIRDIPEHQWERFRRLPPHTA
jgi:hypothetical protein